MKILLAYSSKTGNTKKVAEAIRAILPTDSGFINLSENPQPDTAAYDMIIIGTWIDKGSADPVASDFIKTLKNKKTAVFFTLGANPDSKYAGGCAENLKQLFLICSNEICGCFFCQGALDPKLIEMSKTLPPEHPRALSPEQEKLYQIAARHPDENDLKNAQNYFSRLIAQYKSS